MNAHYQNVNTLIAIIMEIGIVLTGKGGMMMVDQEKVIKGLEHCCDPDMCNEECPYYKDYDEVSDCTSKLVGDALELLKRVLRWWEKRDDE